ncbi:cytochrome P450 [Xylaria sp. FL1042]|nr:cytochrome P450 [Xylaria sp. FL1042]
MLVTPGRNWLYLGHPDIVMDVVRRRDDFPECVELTQVLDIFGPNVGSVRRPSSISPYTFTNWESGDIVSEIHDRDVRVGESKSCPARIWDDYEPHLYETLRLYTPVSVTKWTKEKTQTLKVGNKTLVLPPNTMMCGPSRFIKPVDIKCTPDSGRKVAQEENFRQPKRGTFVGWSESARDCPGRKFSQVEFVATIASLFRDWRVNPVTIEGETIELARERVLDLIKTDSAMVLLQQMLHPERAPLTWSKR